MMILHSKGKKLCQLFNVPVNYIMAVFVMGQSEMVLPCTVSSALFSTILQLTLMAFIFIYFVDIIHVN